jgi:hypothetical protein
VKRFLGWLLVLAGGAGALWGGFCVLTGSSQAHMQLGSESVAALPGGLIGLAVMTLGLIWVRD